MVEEIDEDTTHVVVALEDVTRVAALKKAVHLFGKKTFVVYSQWITDSIRLKDDLDVRSFVVR